jgi:RimJ/RimL family protein N-acetyltransferase
MLIVADSDVTKWAMFNFLCEHGVRLSRSEDFQAIGRLSENTRELIGVVAYNGFCGRVCSMHMAGIGNWISREYIRAAFAYPFKQLELAAVISPVAANNSRALRLDTHFGFREVHRVTDGWERGVDLVLLELKREHCRHLGEKQNETALAA